MTTAPWLSKPWRLTPHDERLTWRAGFTVREKNKSKGKSQNANGKTTARTTWRVGFTVRVKNKSKGKSQSADGKTAARTAMIHALLSVTV
jgi:hypothetical protein